MGPQPQPQSAPASYYQGRYGDPGLPAKPKAQARSSRQPFPGGIFVPSNYIMTSNRDIIELVSVWTGKDEDLPSWPTPHPMIYDAVRWINLAIDVCWLLVLLAGWISKYFLENPEHFGHFLTNWSWVLQTIYFAFKVASLATGSRHLIWFTYSVLFWPVWINTWAVMWLVILVLADSPGLVTDVFDQYGAGTVLAADRLYHVVTLAIMVIDFFLSVKDHFSFWLLRTKSVWIMIVVQVVFAHAIVLTYLGLNNIRSVYDLHQVYWWTMLLCYEPVVLFNGILFMFVCSQFRRAGGWDFSNS